MNLLNKIKLLFTYGPELEKVLKILKDKKLEQERENNRYRLNLCYKHRQESKYSDYSSQNCDYCKLLKQLEELKK